MAWICRRLGHSGAGVTTLRVYSAWQPEADTRAATLLGKRLPAPLGLAGSDVGTLDPTEPTEDSSPYRRIASDLLGAIQCGALAVTTWDVVDVRRGGLMWGGTSGRSGGV